MRAQVATVPCSCAYCTRLWPTTGGQRAEKPAHVIFRCKGCGKTERLAYDHHHRTARVVDGQLRGPQEDERCACGRRRLWASVQGRVGKQPCGGKCMASKGPSCECACGGANHGSSYSPAT